MFVGLTFVISTRAEAGVLLDVSREIVPDPKSTVEQFSFEIREADTKIVLEITSTLREGGAKVRVLDPTGQVIREHNWRRWLTVQGDVLQTSDITGMFQLEVSTDAAVGKWQIRIFELSKRSPFSVFLIPGPAMILIALGSILYWKRRSETQWRWFLVGAGIWTVGVSLKFICAAILNQPILHGLKNVFPGLPYILAGGIYVGLLTGIFEIGITLAAACIWRRLAQSASRAVAVGVGAGAFEALLLGLAGFVAILLAISGMRGTESASASIAEVALVTPFAWLVGPVERAIAILCHTSSRTLVLLSVAKRRWSYFFWGFMIMTGIDAIAGFAHLSGKIGQFSLWWIELAIGPFAVASVLILRWCLSHWPGNGVSERTSVSGTR